MNRSPPQLRIALVLGVAAGLAALGLIPYLLTLLAQLPQARPLSVATLIAEQGAGNAIAMFLLAWAGLKLGAPFGLAAPWLAVALYRRERPAHSAWVLAALAGVVSAAILWLLFGLFGTPIESAPLTAPTAWQGLLAMPYGGIAEEVLCRAFAMSALVWLLARTSAGRRRPWQIGVAIVLAALLFGAAHLPLAAKLVALDAGVVVRVIGYNALVGLASGALYARYGLEHAMLAHACADVVLHGIAFG